MRFWRITAQTCGLHRTGFAGRAALEFAMAPWLRPKSRGAVGATTFGTRWTDYWVDDGKLPVDTWTHTAAVFDQTL